MRPTTQNLAMRNPALAALVGVLPAEGNFGEEPTFGGFGIDDEIGDEFGFGTEEVVDGQLHNFTAGHNAALRERASYRQDQQMLRVDQRKLEHYARLDEERKKRAAAHEMRLDPNEGQSLKLGGYSFGLSQNITIGLGVGLYMSDSPATTIRTKRVVMNVPGPGFATVSALSIANVNTTVGGSEDADAYSSRSFSNGVDYPTLPPSQKATMTGTYTSFAPAPLFNGQAFLFSVRFSGTSTIAGGC